MNNENIDFTNELQQMEKKINYYKSKLQNYYDKYIQVETEIYRTRQLQHKVSFVMNNVQIQNLQEDLQNMRLNFEVCVEKSGGYEDLSNTIHAKINELKIQKNILMKELAHLKKNTDNNNQKLIRVNIMITEQEGKNAVLLQELQTKSENITSIPIDIKKQIDTVLQNVKLNESSNITNNVVH